MENRYHTLTLTNRKFGDTLWETVGETLKILTQAGYVCKIDQETHGVVVIKYQYKDPAYGYPSLCWLTIEEEELLIAAMKLENKEQEIPNSYY